MTTRRRATGPVWPLVPAAIFVLFVAPLLLAVVWFGQSEARENLGYLLLLVAGPFAASLLWALGGSSSADGWERQAPRVLLLTAATLLLVALGALLYQRGIGWPLEIQIAVQLGLLLLLSLAILAGRLPEPAERLCERLDRWAVPALLAALIVFCAILAPLYQPRDIRVSAFFGWLQTKPAFLPLLLAAWPLAYLLPRIPPVRRGPVAWAALAAALAFALLLYDDGFFVEYSHYMPYVGPALHALNGGVPMVEVYSQYGILPWALIWAAYHWLPETYGSAAVIVRLFTVAWYLTLPLTVWRLSANKPVAALVSAAGLLWVIGFHADALNMNGLPSTQGYRYLLPALVVTWLAWTPAGGLRSLGLFLLVAIASLWSAETAAFAAGPPIALALLEAIRERGARRLIGQALLVVAAVATGHLALAVYLQAAYGRWPDYVPFFEMLGFFKPDESGVTHWSEIMPYGFGLWVPVAGILFSVLALAGRDALARRVAHPRAWSLIPAAVLAVGQLSYFVGRSYTTTLGLALLPFLIVALVGLDALVERWRDTRGGALRAERLLVALAVAGCFAFAAERFQRPYNAGASNATILRHCFAPAGCAPGTIAERIEEAVTERTIDIDLTDPRNFAVAGNGFLDRLSEIERFVRTYASDQRRVGLLVDTFRISYLGIPAMADLGKWYPWPISSPTNDGQSPSLARRVLASAQPPRNGELLIVANDGERMAAIVEPLTELYATHCTLTPIESGRFYAVVRTSDCRD